MNLVNVFPSSSDDFEQVQILTKRLWIAKFDVVESNRCVIVIDFQILSFELLKHFHTNLFILEKLPMNFGKVVN